MTTSNDKIQKMLPNRKRYKILEVEKSGNKSIPVESND